MHERPSKRSPRGASMPAFFRESLCAASASSSPQPFCSRRSTEAVATQDHARRSIALAVRQSRQIEGMRLGMSGRRRITRALQKRAARLQLPVIMWEFARSRASPASRPRAAPALGHALTNGRHGFTNFLQCLWQRSGGPNFAPSANFGDRCSRRWILRRGTGPP
jgi:hypothetical protein